MDAEYLDFHVHMAYGVDVEPFVRAARKLNVAMAVNGCGPFWGGADNDAVEAAAAKYPDTIIPIGFVGLGRGGTPETVEDLHRRGFKGLKMIAPIKDYDDPEYFPIYAKAEQLRLPILFHTGVVARADVWLKELAARGRPVPPHDDPRTFNISSKRMEPMCVDAIVRAFPDLNCVMAHFGSTGRRDVCEGLIQWNPNLYGDMTSYCYAYEVDETERGWHIEPAHVEYFLQFLKPMRADRLAGKLLFGTDVTTAPLELYDAKVASHKAVYAALGIGEEGQRLIFRDTAARLLGLD
jgi:predicted TIM-barrel fold metal-dependent hydrolase